MKNKLFLLIFFFILFPSFTYAALTDGLITYWDNQNYTIQDIVGNNDLTNNGAVLVTGKLKNALNYTLSEEDYANKAYDYDTIINTGNYTLSAWIKSPVSTCAGSSPSFWRGCVILNSYTTGGKTGNFIFHIGGDGKLKIMNWYADGILADGNKYSANGVIIPNSWHHVVMVYNGSVNLFVNNTKIAIIGSTTTYDGYLTGTYQGKSSTGTNYQFDGIIDEVGIWNRSLTDIEVSYLWSNGSACNPILSSCDGVTPPPVNDTTPPNINNVIQLPTNITVYSIVDSGVNISANITDNVNLNYSSIYLNLSLNFTTSYINGSLINNNKTYNYSLNISNKKFIWLLGENELLSYTTPLNHDIFENTPHLNDSLKGLNYYLKMTFYNVTNKRNQNFVEMMTENETSSMSNAQYYYCNSNYSVGSPVSSNDCVLFADVDNNLNYSHGHGQYSKHKVFPMGINTTNGMIGNVYVTPISYILKRGTSTGDLYFYVPNISRINQSQISNNNGNTWSNILGTVDSHIHQISNNEIFYYQICASDNSSNKNCTNWSYESIDFPILPPNSVNIYSPIATSYNGSILINHSKSISASFLDIIGYKYEYSYKNGSWTNLVLNNYPDTTYNWDVENKLNGGYNIRITVTDELNQTSYSISETFTINNEESLNTQLLSSIDDTLNNIFEVLYLIPLVLLYMMFTIVGLNNLKIGELIMGYLFMFISVGFDFFWMYFIYENYLIDLVTKPQLQQVMYLIFGSVVIVCLFAKIIGLFYMKVTRKVILNSV